MLDDSTLLRYNAVRILVIHILLKCLCAYQVDITYARMSITYTLEREWCTHDVWIDTSVIHNLFYIYSLRVIIFYILVIMPPHKSKDPLGLGLDLHVPVRELDSIDDDLRPPFVFGMSCPVATCGDREFVAMNTIHKHWTKYHRQSTMLYLCGFQGCAFRSPTKGLVLKHKSRKEHLTPPFQTELVSNRLYIDPKEAKCPKRAAMLNVAGREAARAERAKTSVVTENIIPVTYNTRDEIVTVGREGQPILQVDPRWMRLN